MIEVLVALAIILVALVVSLAVVAQSTKVARVTRQRLEATKYAEKVLENLRRERDLDQESFFAAATCASCGPFGVNQEFACQLSCTFSPTQVEAEVVITWEEAGAESNVNLSTILTKYKL